MEPSRIRQAKTQPVLKLRPSAIRFTQDSICDRFSNLIPVETTYKKLLYGDLQVSDLEKIEVVNDEGVWWVIEGNRRLFLLKWLEEVKEVKEVEVIVRDLKDLKVMAVYKVRKTTRSDGKSIVCRGGKLEEKLKQIDDVYNSEQYKMLIEQCSVERLDSEDYSEHYVPDFLPGCCRRKYRKDITYRYN